MLGGSIQRSGVSCALVALALGLSAATTVAQEATGEAEERGVQGLMVDEIFVTARRRAETLQETPVAITALPASHFENRATVNIGDLQGFVPNLLITVQNSGAAAANISIRGLAFADIEKSFDPTVAVVVDGAFIGTNTGQFFDFFDIEQIEVLRGPQGTLFGRNTIGGVISMQRTRPTMRWGVKAEASYGNYDRLVTRAVLNVPLIEDRLGAKFFHFHNEHGGFYRHALTGDRVGSINNENFGMALRFENAGVFDANLTLEKQVQKTRPTASSVTNADELFCEFMPANECSRAAAADIYTVFMDQGLGRYSSPAATLEMNLTLGGVTLTSITNYRDMDEAHEQDFDASSADLYFADRRQNYDQFSQELRAAGEVLGGLDYVVGGYYYKHEYDLLQLTRVFGEPDVPLFNEGSSESYAVFGDFNWALMNDVRLSFGGRWTHDKKTNATRLDDLQFPKVSESFNKFTPKVGLDYRPTEDLMAYASWSRGYRAGGFSARGTTLISSTTPFRPETVDSYEIGFKSAWLDRRLTFNVAAFYADYKDLQQTTTIPQPESALGNETIVTNVGSATIKGLEVDVVARPLDRWTLNGSLGLLDSKFKGFITQAPDELGTLFTFDYSAVNLIYNPKITLSLTSEYEIPTSFGSVLLNASYRFIDNYDQQISLGPTEVAADGTIIVLSNDPRVRADTQHLVDLSATALFEIGQTEARFTVWGRNILDDRGPAEVFTVAGLWSYAVAREPRTYGVTLGFNF